MSEKQPTNTEKELEEKVFSKIVFFSNHCRTSSRKLEQLEKKTRRIVKNTFKVFRGIFLGRFCGMKKLCTSFLVVGRRHWTFGENFLSKFLKLQPEGAAQRFEVFLERRVIVWPFSISERKQPSFGKKLLAGFLKVHFTCPQQNFEKKW